MSISQNHNQPNIDVDNLLLELDHQLIDLRHSIKHRFDSKSLSDVLKALLATQTTLQQASVTVAVAVKHQTDRMHQGYPETPGGK